MIEPFNVRSIEIYPYLVPKGEGKWPEEKYVLKEYLEPSLHWPSFLGVCFWFSWGKKKSILGFPILTWGFLTFAPDGKKNKKKKRVKWSHGWKWKRSNALFHRVGGGQADLQSLLTSVLEPGLWTWPQLCKSWSGEGGWFGAQSLLPMASVSFRYPPYEFHFSMPGVEIRHSKWNSLRTTAFLLIFRSQLKLGFNVKFALGSADGSQTSQASVCLLHTDVVLREYKTARERIPCPHLAFPPSPVPPYFLLISFSAARHTLLQSAHAVIHVYNERWVWVGREEGNISMLDLVGSDHMLIFLLLLKKIPSKFGVKR